MYHSELAKMYLGIRWREEALSCIGFIRSFGNCSLSTLCASCCFRCQRYFSKQHRLICPSMLWGRCHFVKGWRWLELPNPLPSFCSLSSSATSRSSLASLSGTVSLALPLLPPAPHHRVVNSALFDPTLVLAHSPIAGLITMDFYDLLTCLSPPQRGELHGGPTGWGHTHPGATLMPHTVPGT